MQKNIKKLKESLISGNRKPVSKLSISLFAESAKAEKKALAESRGKVAVGARRKIAEASSKYWDAFDFLLDRIGEDTLLDEIMRSFSDKEAQETLSFIARNHDIEEAERILSESQRRRKIAEASEKYWDAFEVLHAALGTGDLLDEIMRSFSDDEAHETLSFIARNHLDDTDEHEEFDNILNESQRRKPAVGARRKLAESVAPAFDNKDGKALFAADIMYHVEDENGQRVDAGGFAEKEIYAGSEEELMDKLVLFVKAELRKAVATKEAAELNSELSDLFFYGNAVSNLEVDAEDLAALHFEVQDGEVAYLSGELLVLDMETGDFVSLSDVGVSQVFESEDVRESLKPRRKIAESATKQQARRRLEESVSMPITGMEYRVYKRGNEGMGDGGVIAQGLARVQGNGAIVQGKRYDFSKYSFVGTKGF